ncbi:hypothetical protein PG994_007069 [Apiospora phragmitis]|uniref:Uncharacterized protein n=1 Tax=Apiospora phragmitis TaxID=2905665 RepID=A0ABR1V296_9PEZI
MKVDVGIGHGFVTAAPLKTVMHHGSEPPKGSPSLRWTKGLKTENLPGKEKCVLKAPRRGKTSRLVASSEGQEEPVERTEPKWICRKQRHGHQETAIRGRSSPPSAGGGDDGLYNHRNDLDFQRWTRDGLPLYSSW